MLGRELIGLKREDEWRERSSIRNRYERNRKQRPKVEDEQGIDCGDKRMTIRVEIEQVEDKEQ